LGLMSRLPLYDGMHTYLPSGLTNTPWLLSARRDDLPTALRPSGPTRNECSSWPPPRNTILPSADMATWLAAHTCSPTCLPSLRCRARVLLRQTATATLDAGEATVQRTSGAEILRTVLSVSGSITHTSFAWGMLATRPSFDSASQP